MKIALAFWGLSRSLRYTLNSIHKHIFDVLKANNIEYKTFVHTYSLHAPFSNRRTGENEIFLNNEEYKLLNPDYSQIDDQDTIKTWLNLHNYYSQPDPWGTHYNSVNNFILAMYSKKILGEMICKSNEGFDYVLFLRPDVLYLNDFKTEWFNLVTETQVCAPDFQHWEHNFNDRFCMSTQKNAILYSTIFNFLLEYSVNKMLHSETIQRDYITKHFNLTIAFIPFRFNRVRANGYISEDTSAPIT